MLIKLIRASSLATKLHLSTSSAGASSLLDTFGRKHDYLRISLTERCNLRCVYCMPEEGVQLTPGPKLMTTEEVYRLAELFVKRFGAKKIRLTGGEPLVRRDIVSIVQELSKLKQHGLEKIGITTNGIVLARHCHNLRQAGLDSVNISLDTLKADRFQLITRRNGLDKVLRSIETALNEGFDSIKINCVPIKGVNEDEMEDFVELTRNTNLEVRFIEYMPFDGNRWRWEKMLPYRELKENIEKRFPLKQLPPKSIHETAVVYQVDGYTGTVGFVASMTNAFCSGCNRVRLTADGHLKVCLFGKEEISLKDALRSGSSDDELCQMIVNAVKQKKKQHSGAFNIAKHSNRPMILIAPKVGQQVRNCSSGTFQDLTHLDSRGEARMVNVGSKNVTIRSARAEARVRVGEDVLRAIEHDQVAKGNVLAVARLAAIQGAKWTCHLVPLCHQIPLDQVDCRLWLDKDLGEVAIESTARATYRTGVEMEALTAASVAALTIYDMCKSLNKGIEIRHIRLVEKTGGKSGHFHRE